MSNIKYYFREFCMPPLDSLKKILLDKTDMYYLTKEQKLGYNEEIGFYTETNGNIEKIESSILEKTRLYLIKDNWHNHYVSEVFTKGRELSRPFFVKNHLGHIFLIDKAGMKDGERMFYSLDVYELKADLCVPVSKEEILDYIFDDHVKNMGIFPE